MALSSSYANPSPLFVATPPVKKRRDQSGFSLVELSIVLVILGLLTGGILAGQSLIRAAELRSISTDTQRYQTAISSFRDKYFAMPGDMRNAVRFWGAQAGATTDGTDSTCTALTTAATGTATCNGDGNGRVGDGTHEMHRFWQHLANAGLVEGSYTGIAGPGGAITVIPGLNAPRSKLSNGGFGFSYLDFPGGDVATYGLNYGHVLWFGASTNSGSRTQVQILKPEEAWNIDTKMDDGKPASGKIIGRPDPSGFGTAASCVTSANQNDLTGDYRLLNTALACALMIRVD